MNSKKIIILDDDENIVRILKNSLSGNYVVGFVDAAQAIQQIRVEEFDLLILDYFLINTTGETVIEEIRKFNKKIFIFLITGYKDHIPVDETLKKLDIQFYCEKSANIEGIINNIKSILKTIHFINQEKPEKSFAVRLKELRIAHNLSQEHLANIVGSRSRTTIGNWEAGLSEPSIKTLKKLATYFGVTIDYIVGHETDFINILHDKNHLF